MSKLKVNHYVVGPVQTNCYFAINEETKELLVIDPGASAKQLAERIRQEGCKPVAILLTHGHFDHATGAEELAQDVFMKVFKHLSSFKGECSFSTWIYRIAYNTAISETRKKRHEFLAIEESVINNVSEQEVAEALDRTDSSDQIQMLDAALAQLPPDERAIILLFYMKEKTIDEVATITGLTASNIKVKLHRIRKKLFFVLKGMEEQ